MYHNENVVIIYTGKVVLFSFSKIQNAQKVTINQWIKSSEAKQLLFAQQILIWLYNLLDFPN